MEIANKADYSEVIIKVLIGFYLCASFNCEFEGFICDSDNKSVLETYTNQHPHLLGE